MTAARLGLFSRPCFPLLPAPVCVEPCVTETRPVVLSFSLSTKQYGMASLGVVNHCSTLPPDRRIRASHWGPIPVAQLPAVRIGDATIGPTDATEYHADLCARVVNETMPAARPGTLEAGLDHIPTGYISGIPAHVAF